MIVGWVKGSKSYYPISDFEGTLSCPCKGFQWRSKCRHMTDFKAGKFCSSMIYRLVAIDEYGVATEIEGVQRFNPDQISTEEIIDNLSRSADFLSRLLGLKIEFELVESK